MDTTVENEIILHKIWPRVPPMIQEPALNSVRAHGKVKTEYSRSDMAMFEKVDSLSRGFHFVDNYSVK